MGYFDIDCGHVIFIYFFFKKSLEHNVIFFMIQYDH